MEPGGNQLYPDKQSPVNEMSEKTSDGALEPPGESPSFLEILAISLFRTFP
jgi:hypothetical protein